MTVRRLNQLPLLNKFEAWSFRLFGRFAPYFLKNVFTQVKVSLEKGRVRIFPETYISLMFFVALLTVPVSVIAGITALLYWLSASLDLSSPPSLRYRRLYCHTYEQCQRKIHKSRARNAIRCGLHQRHVVRRHSSLYQLQTLNPSRPYARDE